MNRDDLVSRIRRLDELMQGFAKETARWKAGHDPLLFVERRAYLGAIQDTLAGLEAARAILTRADQRLQREKRNSTMK
jgi:hypothetical protein